MSRMLPVLAALVALAPVDNEASSGGASLSDAAPPAKPRRLAPGASRSLLLASREAPFELVVWPPNVPPEEQVQFALVRPSAGVKSRIFNESFEVSSDAKQIKMQTQKQQALALVHALHTVTPDGKPEAKVFEHADVAELLKQPAGPESIVEVLGGQVLKSMEVDVKKDLEAAKND